MWISTWAQRLAMQGWGVVFGICMISWCLWRGFPMGIYIVIFNHTTLKNHLRSPQTVSSLWYNVSPSRSHTCSQMSSKTAHKCPAMPSVGVPLPDVLCWPGLALPLPNIAASAHPWPFSAMSTLQLKQYIFTNRTYSKVRIYNRGRI